MLHLATQLCGLNFEQLMGVYAESNRENGELMYPDLTETQQIITVERSFYQYLAESFFSTKGAVYAIWTEAGRYTSALRLEPYEDGLLLEALETAPDFRRKGYASALIRAVQERFPERIYSHVHRKNKPSMAVHEQCGFLQVEAFARYIDGSVNRNAVTLRYR